MKLPAILTLKAKTSTVEQLAAALADVNRQRADAEREHARLGVLRPDLLLTATNIELGRHDDAMAQCRRDIEQAEARRAVLEPELREAQRLEAEKTDAAERVALYDAGSAALAEGRKIVREYEAAAQALADKLRRLDEAHATIIRANNQLPDGKAALGFPEPFNGRQKEADRPTPMIETWFDADGRRLGTSPPAGIAGAVKRLIRGYGPDTIEGRPGVAHRPLADRVALPRLDPNAGHFWRGKESIQQSDPGREAALRFMGIAS